ncbi:TetR/AcrR family transcriptional regulator [Agrococcus sp. Marseille-P2731]|uniref:TetR/AcrR family transcriptional regulator n=1 Tax=Agrococcus sp. Marseille-P2731 TaxID=1841862 RepID=UPI0013562AA7|nr:TetR/AcrR family transcriptional regulator [Agrococcus sp. Marseille-P2731]
MPSIHDTAPMTPSLRIRKKQVTHRAITDAALALANERGFSNVTLDQIAERAFISARTVTNYFASKEAALLAAFDTPCDDLFAMLAARPAEEHPLRSVQAAITADVRSWDESRLALVRARESMLAQNPSVASLQLSQLERFGHAIHSTLALRAGTDPFSELTSRLAAGITVIILKTATTRWTEVPDDAARLAALLDEAFDEAAQGDPLALPISAALPA